MSKKKQEELKKQLSPQELAKYRPEDTIPKIQETFGLGLDTMFDLAKQSGAIAIGASQTSITPIPRVNK